MSTEITSKMTADDIMEWSRKKGFNMTQGATPFLVPENIKVLEQGPSDHSEGSMSMYFADTLGEERFDEKPCIIFATTEFMGSWNEFDSIEELDELYNKMDKIINENPEIKEKDLSDLMLKAGLEKKSFL